MTIKLSKKTKGEAPKLLVSEYFKADGTWTRPANIGDEIYVTVVGGGATGMARSAYNGSSPAGNGGEYLLEEAVDISSIVDAGTVAVTVGLAGNQAVQWNGYPSSFGAFVTAAGGESGEWFASWWGEGRVGGWKAGHPARSTIMDGDGSFSQGTWRSFGYNGGNKAPGGGGGIMGFGDCEALGNTTGFAGGLGAGHGAGSGGRYGSATNNYARPGIVVVQYYKEV